MFYLFPCTKPLWMCYFILKHNCLDPYHYCAHGGMAPGEGTNLVLLVAWKKSWVALIVGSSNDSVFDYIHYVWNDSIWRKCKVVLFFCYCLICVSCNLFNIKFPNCCCFSSKENVTVYSSFFFVLWANIADKNVWCIKLFFLIIQICCFIFDKLQTTPLFDSIP